VTDVQAFTTGRHLQGCLTLVRGELQAEEPPTENPRIPHDYVTFERPLGAKFFAHGTRPDPLARIARANSLGRDLKQVLVSSVNSPDRYPAGEVSALETDFVAERLAAARRVDEGGRPEVVIPDALRAVLDSRALERLAGMSSSELLRTPAAGLSARLRVSPRMVNALKLAQAGVKAAERPDGGDILEADKDDRSTY
jgi:hypothetical protein